MVGLLWYMLQCSVVICHFVMLAPQMADTDRLNCSSIYPVTYRSQDHFCKAKVKVVDLYSASTRSISKALRYSTQCQEITQLYLHTLCFICKRNELYLLLPSQPQLVFIYRPLRDGRLSRPWCEVAKAEVRTCNLPIANPALYHTATSTQ